MRARFYQWMSILDDEETQKKGVVFVAYAIFGPHHGQSSPDAQLMQKKQLMKKGIKLVRALPLRIRARHVCTDSKSMGLFISILSPLMDRNARVRARVHVGTLNHSSSKQWIGFTMACLQLYSSF
jgi:hypothetical protein